MSRNHFRHPYYRTRDDDNRETFAQEARDAAAFEAYRRAAQCGRRILPVLDVEG